MKREHAYEAIKAILAAIDDSELPKPDKIETTENGTYAWFGGTGRGLGLAKSRRNGGEWQRDPIITRESGARDAIEREAVYRLDRDFKDQP